MKFNQCDIIEALESASNQDDYLEFKRAKFADMSPVEIFALGVEVVADDIEDLLKEVPFKEADDLSEIIGILWDIKDLADLDYVEEERERFADLTGCEVFTLAVARVIDGIKNRLFEIGFLTPEDFALYFET